MKAAWEWVKKHWEIVAGLLILLLGFLFGVAVRKRPVIVQGSNPEKKEAEEEAEAKTRKAEQQAEDKKAEAQKEHEADLAVMVDKIQDKSEDIRGDTQKTNEYLKDVGKHIRGEE